MAAGGRWLASQPAALRHLPCLQPGHTCPVATPRHLPTPNLFAHLAGQRTGVQIYHDHIACQEFIDLRRLWSRQGGEGTTKPVLDLSFLIDHVMHSVHPLDWDAVLASPLPLKVGGAAAGLRWGGWRGSGMHVLSVGNLHVGTPPPRIHCTGQNLAIAPQPPQVVASSLDTLDAVLLDDFECKRDLAECLKVSPVGCRQPHGTVGALHAAPACKHDLA